MQNYSAKFKNNHGLRGLARILFGHEFHGLLLTAENTEGISVGVRGQGTKEVKS